MIQEPFLVIYVFSGDSLTDLRTFNSLLIMYSMSFKVGIVLSETTVPHCLQTRSAWNESYMKLSLKTTPFKPLKQIGQTPFINRFIRDPINASDFFY